MKINLIPMAGEGKRFKDAGFSTPKPLIDVNGLPMVVRALQSLPEADQNILIVRRDQVNPMELKKEVLKHFKDVLIIEIDKLTEGQASTCMFAEQYIQPDNLLTIGACDNGLVYNSEKLKTAIQQFDTLAWSFRNQQNVETHPEMYGWIDIEKNTNQIKHVSCKVPISDHPKNDHAITGTFTFKKAAYFFDGVREMIRKNDRVNNEFYVDNVFNHIPKLNGVFEVEKYICWGTPNDLNNYLKNEI